MSFETRIPADVYKALRKKAEELLEAHVSGPEKQSEMKSIDHLILELDVYQTELEIQNDELRSIQHKLEETLEKYSDLYDFAPAGYLTIDKDGVILEANLTASGMLGIERRQLTGKPLAIFVGSESKNDFYNYLKMIPLSGNVRQSIDLKIAKKDGTTFYGMFLSEISKKSGSKPEAVRIILQDISERKKLEDELKRKNREMEDFSYRLSHDIKTPLMSVYSYIEIIEEDPAGKVALLSMLKNRIKEIAVYLEKILELSKAGKVIGETELLSVKDIITMAMSTLQTKGIPYKLICNIKAEKFSGNFRSMYAAFLNLLENAFKYRDNNKDVLIIEITSVIKNDNLEITFKDNGIGISRKDLEKIFQPGYSVSLKNGTGFGLPIVEKVVKAHNGKIMVKSLADGDGTEFTMVIPSPAVSGSWKIEAGM